MSPSSKVRRAHILLATDLSPASKPHVQFAARLADRLGAHTTLFHAAIGRSVVVEPMMTVLPVEPAMQLDECRRQLQALATSCATSHPVHVAVEAGADARTAILEAAARIEADLLILPTHGRSGLQRALLGSTAEQVLRHATRPVMLITDRMLPAEPRDAKPGQPVLLTTDLSPVATTAHRPAADLARRLGRPLLLASVLPTREPAAKTVPGEPPPPDAQQRLREQLKRLREVATALSDGIQVEALVQVADEPAAAIVELARTQDAAFLVMATHARKGVARMLQGSIAEHVVRHATVPVLCVPAHEG